MVALQGVDTIVVYAIIAATCEVIASTATCTRVVVRIFRTLLLLGCGVVRCYATVVSRSC